MRCCVGVGTSRPLVDVGDVPRIFFYQGSRLDDALLELIRTHVASAGCELVDITHGGTDQRPVLRIKVDIPGSRPGHGISVGQCATLSRTLEHTLEASALVGSQYVLEVSSPGVERPVRWPEHWRRFVGRQVRVKAPPLGRNADGGDRFRPR